MYNIAIVDDEIFTCSSIEKILLDYSATDNIPVRVEVFYSGSDFQKNSSEVYYDILFLDIVLPDISGIEIAQFIREDMKNEQIQIIYMSSKTEYALKLFKTRPMDFLVKPFSPEQVIEEFKQAKKLIDSENSDFEFAFKNKYYKIPLNKVMYFQSKERKILLYTEDHIYEFYNKLDNISKEVPYENFWRIHKSYLINYIFVTEYTYEWVKMKNKIILPISQSSRKEIRNRLLDYRKRRKHEYKICD